MRTAVLAVVLLAATAGTARADQEVWSVRGVAVLGGSTSASADMLVDVAELKLPVAHPQRAGDRVDIVAHARSTMPGALANIYGPELVLSDARGAVLAATPLQPGDTTTVIEVLKRHVRRKHQAALERAAKARKSARTAPAAQTAAKAAPRK